VTPWYLTAGALLVLLLIATVTAVRGDTMDRLVTLKLVGVIVPLVVIALAVATGQSALLEVAAVLVVLSFVGSLAYARFLERWL
jgi:multicomponent Na+:H+ antiporter subunit F